MNKQRKIERLQKRLNYIKNQWDITQKRTTSLENDFLETVNKLKKLTEDEKKKETLDNDQRVNGS